MAPIVFNIFIGGDAKWNAPIKKVFNQPLGPKSALKLTATTTVGIINGMVVKVRNNDFPGNLNLANKYAAGIPIKKVNRVDTPACQNVNQSDCPILDH